MTGLGHDYRTTVSLMPVRSNLGRGRIRRPIPIADEPILDPNADRTVVDCFRRSSRTRHCYEYDGQVYAEYDTAEETTVYLSAELGGRNERLSGG